MWDMRSHYFYFMNHVPLFENSTLHKKWVKESNWKIRDHLQKKIRQRFLQSKSLLLWDVIYNQILTVQPMNNLCQSSFLMQTTFFTFLIKSTKKLHYPTTRQSKKTLNNSNRIIDLNLYLIHLKVLTWNVHILMVSILQDQTPVTPRITLECTIIWFIIRRDWELSNFLKSQKNHNLHHQEQQNVSKLKVIIVLLYQM